MEVFFPITGSQPLEPFPTALPGGYPGSYAPDQDDDNSSFYYFSSELQRTLDYQLMDLRSRRLTSYGMIPLDFHDMIRNATDYLRWKNRFGPRNPGPRKYGNFDHKQHANKLFRNNTFGAKDQMKFKAEKLEKLKKNE